MIALCVIQLIASSYDARLTMVMTITILTVEEQTRYTTYIVASLTEVKSNDVNLVFIPIHRDASVDTVTYQICDI